MCVCVCVYLYSKDMHPQTIDFIRSHVYFISKCLEQYLQVYIYMKIGIRDADIHLTPIQKGSPPQSRKARPGLP